MAIQIAELSGMQQRRRRALIMPREHGAWGMLLVPLATGAAVALTDRARIGPLLLLIVVALTLFWLRTPLESWLGTSAMRAASPEERRFVGRTVLVLAVFGVAALTALFWIADNSRLLWIGVIAGIVFATQAVLKKSIPKARAEAQLIGALGLTSLAAASYYVATGRLDANAWVLWMANWLFAADQIRFVQLRIHSARATGLAAKLRHGVSFLVGQTILAGLLALAGYLKLLPWFSLLAFLPILVRGLTWFAEKPSPINIRRLGWTELAHSVAFGILLVAGFY